MKKYMYVANWKMTMTPEKSCDFFHANYHELYELAEHADIVLCPSFVSLGLLSSHIRNTEVALGAQNCSEHVLGAFTGEVDAQSLEQLGCSYCIIGHSERRSLFNETDSVIAHKAARLLEQNITPIICIGETKEQNQCNQTYDALKAQLTPIIDLYRNTTTPLIIAYEPVWAIGTGLIPTIEQLNAISAWIKNHVATMLPHAQICILYGGSVHPTTIKSIKSIPLIDGFLIGGASGDFQTFKNIVV